MIQPAGGIRSDDHRRVSKLGGPGICFRVEGSQPGTSGEVARPLLVIAAQPAPLLSSSPNLAAGSSILAGKASEPFRGAWYLLSYLSWDG